MMHIPSLKKKTKHLPLQEINTPDVLYLPLKGFRGSLLPMVKAGDIVKKYQQVAVSSGLLVSYLHAPVSGTIESIITLNGDDYIKLVNDFRDDVQEMPSFAINDLSKDTILAMLKEYGIEGSGGARFPTHLKYTIQDRQIDTLIINGAECEPYLSADYSLMKNEPLALLKAVEVLQRVINAKQVVIAIEKQHKELRLVFEPLMSQFDFPISVKLLPNEYPQGGELQLIKSVTGKELQKGSIPSASGVIVTNTGTLWAIYHAFYENKPYTERIITLSGENSAIKGNYKVKIGTSASFILEQLGMEWDTERQSVIFGGPMMGSAVHYPEISVNKGTGGLLILPHAKNKSYNCIQCGYCSDVCPQRLLPMEFPKAMAVNDKDRLMAFNLNDCIECGACAYICPSDVPLMKSIFDGKSIIQNT